MGQKTNIKAWDALRLEQRGLTPGDEGKEGKERRGSETAAKKREARSRRREAQDRPANCPRQAEPRVPAPAAPPIPPRLRPHRKRPVPVRPAGMRGGGSAARPSRGAASAARDPGSHSGLRLPATAARSFLQGHGELAEGIEERAEAAGQAQHNDAQVAPHRACPHLRRRRRARPGELEGRARHRAAAGATSSSAAAALRRPLTRFASAASADAARPSPEGGPRPDAPAH